MSFRTTFSVLVLAAAVSSLAVGCAAETSNESSSASQVKLAGNVGSGGNVSAKSWGNVAVASGGASLHVVAHEVHARGVTGSKVDVAVGADGSFEVGVDRGKRWLVTVEDAEGHSAIVTFGSGQNILRVRADGGSSRVDVGGLHVVGGEARASAALDAALGIEATLAGLDDVFEAANGAIIAAREAVEEAQKAAEQAQKAAEDAQAAAEAAQKAAEEARRAAGQ